MRDDFDSLRRILTENLWYFGSRADFDDKLDCIVPGVVISRQFLERLVVSREGFTTESWRSRVDMMASDPDAGDSVAVRVQQDVDHVGMLCLSELDDDSELWRLYGGNGHGVCLGLDMTQVVNDDNFGLRGPFQVSYSDQRKMAWDPRPQGIHRLAQAEDHLLRKQTAWKYQKEWRFIMHKDNEKTVGYHSVPCGALSTLIFGRRLTAAECKEIASWVQAGPWNPLPRIYCREPVQVTYEL